MTILGDKKTKVITQSITGSQGTFDTKPAARQYREGGEGMNRAVKAHHQ
ncbi:hypothetical protein [Paracoccus marinus]|nr:hypothetical protein [Paracoccus marinus]GLS80087.1 hypothetical protein GCM10007893_08650 [Paracoccus marinus]